MYKDALNLTPSQSSSKYLSIPLKSYHSVQVTLPTRSQNNKPDTNTIPWSWKGEFIRISWWVWLMQKLYFYWCPFSTSMWWRTFWKCSGSTWSAPSLPPSFPPHRIIRVRFRQGNFILYVDLVMEMHLGIFMYEFLSKSVET